MPLFRREHKKTVDGANAKDSPDDNGTTTSTTTTKATNTTTKTASTPSPQKATSPDKASPASRRTVTKPTPKDVTTPQKATQVLYRLNYAVKQRPTEPRRSTELIPLNREFDDMRKQLKALVTAARKYQQSMEELSKCRSEVRTEWAEYRMPTECVFFTFSSLSLLHTLTLTHMHNTTIPLLIGLVTYYRSWSKQPK